MMSVASLAAPDAICICKDHLAGECNRLVGEPPCPLLHYGLPYAWQVNTPELGWQNFEGQNLVILEENFCQPQQDTCLLHVQLKGNNVPVLINFEAMEATFQVPDTSLMTLPLQRLSTKSYGTALLEKGQKSSEAKRQGFFTQWRWYYLEDTAWTLLEQDGRTPQQFVLETKYLAGQEIYRFEVTRDSNSKGTFLLHYKTFQIHHLESQKKVPVRRRPLYCSHTDVINKKSLPFVDQKLIPYLTTVPENWYPVDTGAEYELIPLNPESLEYNLVASEFKSSVTSRRICDIYRLQNPYLWHKYQLKKQHMEQLNHPLHERQLFHGTSDSQAVQSIMRTNFDWRYAGKNATVLGKGSYFALHARCSDRYSGLQASILRWMFLARVLTGRTTKGHSEYIKPPPLDPNKPYGDTFDSCTDREANPTIFVVFDTDQCYPEYVISFQ